MRFYPSRNNRSRLEEGPMKQKNEIPGDCEAENMVFGSTGNSTKWLNVAGVWKSEAELSVLHFVHRLLSHWPNFVSPRAA